MELFLFAAYWFRPASLNFSQRVYAAVDPPVVCCMPATLWSMPLYTETVVCKQEQNHDAIALASTTRSRDKHEEQQSIP